MSTTATPTFLLMLRGEGPKRAARGGGMVGGGRHHTPPPSEDVRRGRSTHTLPPFWPGYKHTLPSKNVESCVRKIGRAVNQNLLGEIAIETSPRDPSPV